MKPSMAAKRLKVFYESALFEQKPFTFTKIRDTPSLTMYHIFDDAGEQIFFTSFYKNSFDLREDVLYKVEFIFATKNGSIFANNKSRDIVFRLFNTILTIAREFIKHNRFDVFYFSADPDEPSRVKLYNALFARFKKELSTRYNLTTIEDYGPVYYFIVDKTSIIEPDDLEEKFIE